MLLLNPVAGLAAGLVLGAGAGAVSGALADYGIADDFIRHTARELEPGSSALLILPRAGRLRTAGPGAGALRRAHRADCADTAAGRAAEEGGLRCAPAALNAPGGLFRVPQRCVARTRSHASRTAGSASSQPRREVPRAACQLRASWSSVAGQSRGCPCRAERVPWR
ncbi:DUF1269 domain-containing protein [Ramlibacter ginsenosidimutans]|uniref:DUF1269 domain-containing protein n=1 Tax=Ramlibacter ginsenosidimutans TaxID=502333 RepID=A0A934WQN7_9BURK|nr:DUF1269 domain-containing protein [Ramlibacter ginsenosidimutans]